MLGPRQQPLPFLCASAVHTLSLPAEKRPGESLRPLLASHPASSSGELSPGVPKIAVAYTHRHAHYCPSGSPQVVSPEERAMPDPSPPSRLAGWTAALAMRGSGRAAAAQSQGLRHRVGLTSCSPKGPPKPNQAPKSRYRDGDPHSSSSCLSVCLRSPVTGSSPGRRCFSVAPLVLVLLSRHQAEVQNQELAGTQPPILVAGAGSGARGSQSFNPALPNP